MSSISQKVFLLSSRELGSDTTYYNAEGTPLSYFNSENSRIAYLNGVADIWWTRSPSLMSSTYVNAVNAYGHIANFAFNQSLGARPALTLPSSMLVSSDGTVMANSPPSSPASISYETAYSGDTLIISWQASTDLDGDTVTYILEQSTDGGTTWEQIATGSNETSYEATVPTGKPSICYRVKATDGTAQSNYCTGEIVGILQSYENLLVGGGI